MSEKLVFIGDSITDAGRRQEPKGLGEGYVRIIAEELAERTPPVEVVNTGIGGHRVRDLRARWAVDALAHEPTVLTVYVGINDTWRRYDSHDETPVESFTADYREMLTEARAAGVPHLVLVEPFVSPVEEGQRAWGEDLDPKRAAVAALAAEFRAAFVPLQSIIAAAAEGREAGALAGDGVHPSPEGARVIADAWLHAYERIAVSPAR